MMREPWEVFAGALTITLLGALVGTAFSVGADLMALTRSDSGMAELASWRDGSRAATPTVKDQNAEPPAAGGSSVVRGDPQSGGVEEKGPLLAMVMFASIPIVTYAVGLISFLRRKRWPYVIMTAMQIGLLFGVALPALLVLFR